MKKLFLFIPVVIALCASVGANGQYGLPKVKVPLFRKDSFSIAKYGAKADGVTINTKSIQNAIDACSAKAGGVVVVPAGLWVTGPIVLKNNTNLHLKRD